MIKLNKHNLPLVLLVIILISGWFYWFHFRPTQIKHDCSWIKHTNEAIPAKPAMNEAELKVKGLVINCAEKTQGYKSIYTEKDFCERMNQLVIDGYKTARPAVPAKDWWEAALPAEYQFCLHDKGL